MIRPSLRRRIALWSSALAGGVLVGFALLSSLLITQAKIERLDVQIEAALMLLGRIPVTRIPPQPESVLAREMALGDGTAIALLVLDDRGAVVYQSETWPPTLDPLLAQVRSLAPVEPLGPERAVRLRQGRIPINLSTYRSPTGRWRVGTIATPQGRGAIAVSLQTIRQENAVLRRIYLITIPGGLLLIAGGAWWLSGQALRPIRGISQQIGQVTAQGLDQRVPTADIDQEFEGLIQSFNAMLERLERSFHQASRFSGDAAHELKTPLAILQGELEQAIQQAEAESPIQQTLTRLLEEVSRLSSIVRKLLLLSQADAGQMALRRTVVNVSQLLEEHLEDVALVAPDLTVELKIEPALKVRCDRDLIAQVLQNLLGNAIKYNQPQGWIWVQAQQQRRGVLLTIANASRPLAAAERVHLFDRFYRGDPAHNRQTDGLGLGLSLSREIARAHGGELSLADSPVEEVRFNLWLPT